MSNFNDSFCVRFIGQSRALRNRLIDLIGAADVAAMSDEDVNSWFVAHDYVTVVLFSGDYHDYEDILVVSSDELSKLLENKKAFWLHR